MMWDDEGGQGWSMHGGSGNEWLLLTVLLVLVAVLAAVLVTLLLRTPRAAEELPRAAWARRGTQAEQVLEDRFARGEIDEDEYRHRREVLRTR